MSRSCGWGTGPVGHYLDSGGWEGVPKWCQNGGIEVLEHIWVGWLVRQIQKEVFFLSD